MTDMASKIKILRKALGLSQTAFGRKVGVSRSVIMNFERGATTPNTIFIEHMCDVFGVNQDWFYEDGEYPILDDNKAKNVNLTEISGIFGKLAPELQVCALKQIRNLLEMQDSQNEKNKGQQ